MAGEIQVKEVTNMRSYPVSGRCLIVTDSRYVRLSIGVDEKATFEINRTATVVKRAYIMELPRGSRVWISDTATIEHTEIEPYERFDVKLLSETP